MKRLALLIALSAPLAACSPAPSGSLPMASQPALRTLMWSGTAEVYPPGRTLKLGVETSLTPFTSAQSATWLLDQGKESLRGLVISPTEGWIVRGTNREPMPALMLKHERQQYAVYGQMQLALLDASKGVPSDGRIVIAGDGVTSVDTEFMFDAQGHLTHARNTVDDPETPGALIAQEFTFSGEVRSNGLIWPKRISILHAGAPYFMLEINHFEAR